MFGYLNLGDPTKIGNNEAQEAVNIKIDNGFLEYKKYDIDESGSRQVKDIDGTTIFLNGTLDISAAASPAPRVGNGYLCRLLQSGGVDIVGTPSMFDVQDYSIDISILPVASGTTPPPGEYEYVITIYNPDTNEESTGIKVGGDFTVTPGMAFQFNSLPALSKGASSTTSPFHIYRNIVFSKKPNAEYRVYRRSPGNSEYLFVPFPKINANDGGASSLPLVDTYQDNQLGFPCANVWLPPGRDFPVAYPYAIAPLDKNGWSVFTVHNDRLWFKRDWPRTTNPYSNFDWDDLRGTSILYYTKRNNFGELPTSNFFKFNTEIVSLHSVDEALIVCCLDDIYVIYGDDEKDFVVKQITDSNTVGCAGYYAATTIEKNLYFLGSEPSDRGGKSAGIYMLGGGGLRRISVPIEPMFPLLKLGEMSPVVIGTVKPRPYYGCASINDRFFVVRANFGTAGAPVLKNIVYDAAANGFCLSDASTTFTYRSKEFGRPGKWDDMKRAFVRGKGEFTVELYYDGAKEDEINFNITGSVPETIDFTVPRYRSNYFSFRLIGKTNAMIHEFGRLE